MILYVSIYFVSELGLMGSAPAAFSRDTLMDARWLLDGVPRLSNHFWHDALRMDAMKQALFMRRVLVLHQLSTKRGGRASSARLSQPDWVLEADRMTVLGFVIQEMTKATADDGTPLFPADVIDKVAQRAVEGWGVTKYLIQHRSNK